MSDERRAAPDFELETAAGQTVRLSELRGRHVVLFFVREFT
jgi:peroxiredoxin